MVNSYLTVKKTAFYELIEKKSKFIGYIKPIDRQEEAIDFINEMKINNWSARHNVYAYVVRENNICKYSDDGEPQGTAGIPILSIIKKNNLKNVVIVVARYFGGILLGRSGLVRAYSDAASGTINCAEIIKKYLCYNCSIFCAYNQYVKLLNIIKKYSGVVDGVDFERDVRLKFHLQVGKFLDLSKKIADFSAGTLNCKVLGENFYDF